MSKNELTQSEREAFAEAYAESARGKRRRYDTQSTGKIPSPPCITLLTAPRSPHRVHAPETDEELTRFHIFPTTLRLFVLAFPMPGSSAAISMTTES